MSESDRGDRRRGQKRSWDERSSVPPQPPVRWPVKPSEALDGKAGAKYCEEKDPCPLTLQNKKRETIPLPFDVEIKLPGHGDVTVTLDSGAADVKQVKAEIERLHGIKESRVDLYAASKGKQQAQLSHQNKDTKDKKPLGDNHELTGPCRLVAVVRREEGLKFLKGGKEISISKDGLSATRTSCDGSCYILVGNQVVVSGRHYWEVEVVNQCDYIYIGALTPENCVNSNCPSSETCCITTDDGSLFGMGNTYNYPAGSIDDGDRVGVLLDLDAGTVLFYKNGVQHGPGFTNISGPLTLGVELVHWKDSIKILPNARPPLSQVANSRVSNSPARVQAPLVSSTSARITDRHHPQRIQREEPD